MKAAFPKLILGLILSLILGCMASGPKEGASGPLLLQPYMKTILPGPYPMTVIGHDPTGLFVSSNTILCAKLIIGHTIKNISSTNVTFCALDDHLGYSWTAPQEEEHDMPEDLSEAVEALSHGRSMLGSIGASPHISQFRTLAPGAVLSTYTSEVFVPLNSTALHYRASCWFNRDGHEVGLHAWTGTVLSAECVIPLMFTN